MKHFFPVLLTTDLSSLTGADVEEAAKETIDIFDQVKETVMGGSRVVVQALVILIVGWWLVKVLCRFTSGLLEKTKFDDSAVTFFNSMFKYVLRILLFIVVISELGIDMSSIIAIFTSVALAIGLSLQGSLANVAGGLLILIMKPFKVGDYIDDGNGHEGTVQALEIIYTKLLTVDHKTVWIPNGTLANSSITNLTSHDYRKIDFNVGIAYDEDIDKVRKILLDLAAGSQYADKTQEPMVFVKDFQSSSVLMVLRVTCENDKYWPTKFELQEAIKKAFDANNIVIPFEHLDVSIDQGENR